MNIIDSILDNTSASLATKATMESLSAPPSALPARRFAVDASCVDNQNKAHIRMMQMVETGAGRAGRVIEKVMSEVPVDQIAPASKLAFRGDLGSDLLMEIAGSQEQARKLHNHALGQAGTLASMPWVRDLASRVEEKKGEPADRWGARLAAHSLNEAFSRLGSRHLIRSVEGQVRGIVSDRFRRIDARPILDAALAAFQAVGLRPYDGRWLETKMELQAIVPTLYQPVAGELLAFGLSMRTSDYGDGAFDIRAFMLRPACANGAIAESVMRAIHVGKRIGDDFALSQKTQDLDTATIASAVGDIVRGAFSPETIETRLSAIRTAFETEIDPKKAQAALRKALTKAETEAATALFNSPDVVTLPPGQTAARMGNAISWLANKASEDGNERRAVDLQEIAGQWLSGAATASARG